MTRPDERKGAVGADRGLECLHIQSQTSLCQQHINFQHCLVAVLELRLNGGYLCRKCHQNAFDLLRLLCTVLQNACVCFHDRLRLHKDSSAGGRDIMMMPLTSPRYSLLTGTTYRPLRMETTLSCKYLEVSILRTMLSSRSRMLFSVARIFAQLVQGVGSRVCHASGARMALEICCSSPG